MEDRLGDGDIDAITELVYPIKQRPIYRNIFRRPMSTEPILKLCNRAIRVRIYPNKEQAILINKTIGCCRFVYNRMLDDRKYHYDQVGKDVQITPANYKHDYPWLKEVDSLALSNAQLNLDKAFSNFFEGRAGFPKFKSKRRSKLSYTTNNVNNSVRIEGEFLRLPKLGMVRAKIHRKVLKDWHIKSVSVSLDAGNYYASILFEYESQVLDPVDPQKLLGLDFSMSDLYVDSDGNRPCNPHYYRQNEKRLKAEQRKLSRCKKGSNNYEKQRLKLQRLNQHSSNQTRDYLNKLSRSLADHFDMIAAEDINLRAMSQCLKLGKSVRDNSFGMFRDMLKYKLEEQGKYFVVVDKFFPSSQLCSKCGRKNPAFKQMNVSKNLSVREWTCPFCGTHHDRDVNAAINIREEGRKLIPKIKAERQQELQKLRKQSAKSTVNNASTLA